MRSIFCTLICIVLVYSNGNSQHPISHTGIEKTTFYLPELQTNNKIIDKASRIALGDLFTNIHNFKIGIIDTSASVILAGLEYDQPWTRDAAINCWNVGSFIIPDIARNTLLSALILDNDTLRIGGQYWDAIIWVTSAWNHYLATGDKQFLKIAYETTVNSLKYFEKTEFNKKYNLFRGLGWSDGVSAYEGKYANTGGSSAAHSWPEYNADKISKPGYGIPMMALSTNCLYYNAYMVADKMEKELKQKSLGWPEKAEKLKVAINRHLWNDSTGMYNFYFDEDEESSLQETLGNAYAILFGVADEQKTNSIFKNQFIAPAGVPCGWPPLERYHPDSLSFARHNAVVWPQIQGFWAQAASKHQKQEMFFHELINLSKHAVRDMQFAEIYHPYTGEIYGGMQESMGEIIKWRATNRQTWSATAYIRMVLNGLIGISIDEESIRFSPCVPDEFDNIRLTNLKFRNMNLNISISGKGSQISKVSVNGKLVDQAIISNRALGDQSIVIQLKE